MRRSLSFFFFVVILFLAVADADIVVDTCQKASQNKEQLDFCVALLQGHPKSHSADLPGLGIILLELIKAKGTEISSRIDELLNDKKLGSNVKIALEDCQTLYSNAVEEVQPTIDSFKAKDYKSANIKVSSMVDAPGTCEDGFKEDGLQSPLVAEDNYFFRLTSIALAITTFA